MECNNKIFDIFVEEKFNFDNSNDIFDAGLPLLNRTSTQILQSSLYDLQQSENSYMAEKASEAISFEELQTKATFQTSENILLEQSTGSHTQISGSNVQNTTEEEKQPHYLTDTTEETNPIQDENLDLGCLNALEVKGYMLDIYKTNANNQSKTKSTKRNRKQEEEEYMQDIEEEACTQKKTKASETKRIRVSMSQNYKGVYTRGLAKLLLEPQSDMDPGLYQMLLTIIQAHQERSAFLQSFDIEEVFNGTLDYIEQKMHGKIVRESKNKNDSDDSKVGNTKQIIEVLFPQEGDDESTLEIKSIVKDLIQGFSESSYYDQWVLKHCDAKGENKLFLFNNADKIKRAFLNPNEDKRPRYCTPLLSDLFKKEFPLKEFMASFEFLFMGWTELLNEYYKNE